jgi:DNA-binding CsgD family transcriptional regulator
MEFGRPVLEAFSAQLLALDRLGMAVSPSRLMSEGLAGLRSLVSFDACWWGECSGGIDGLAPRNWLSGCIGLSADFAREWNRIAASDGFARESMDRLDAVVCRSGCVDPVPAVEAFARRHDLYHVIAITRALPGSGLMHFISLYRRKASRPFEPVHHSLLEQFSAHLMQRWSARIATMVGAGGPSAGDSHALLDRNGEFVYLGARLAHLLHERVPLWEGTQLPPDLREALRQVPGVCRLGNRRLVIQACGELQLISLAPRRHATLLPPRQMSVAMLYADGRSYKEIARETGLSPASVRTYLREIYVRLGVSDKVALSRALGVRPARNQG